MAHNYHIDCGHGWIEVPFSQIIELGIEHKISRYSYREEDMCYLEEDCDASLWYEAYAKRYGHNPELVRIYHTDFKQDLGCQFLDLRYHL